MIKTGTGCGIYKYCGQHALLLLHYCYLQWTIVMVKTTKFRTYCGVTK